MLDLNALVANSKKGDHLLTTLSHDEMVIIQNYSLMSVQAIIKAGVGAHQKTNDIVLNAYRNGLALGLRLKIENGKILTRSEL